jgi:hypothetical protein
MATFLGRALRTFVDRFALSYGQPILLSQALVESGFGAESAQHSDLARHFSGGVASIRQSSTCCFQDCLRHNFRGIAFFHALQRPRWS